MPAGGHTEHQWTANPSKAPTGILTDASPAHLHDEHRQLRPKLSQQGTKAFAGPLSARSPTISFPAGFTGNAAQVVQPDASLTAGSMADAKRFRATAPDTNGSIPSGMRVDKRSLDFQNSTIRRPLEEVMIALRKGTEMLKHGRHGKPKLHIFRLQDSGTHLCWRSDRNRNQVRSILLQSVKQAKVMYVLSAQRLLLIIQ
ncbi:hypothetical protein WJX84_000016 [Apatococcus fuscideae]|uniref:Uncharacterized protein n=1 Tax=Apatococcus fuscideae TaxID=2026836 RepID=A0AAW1SQT2_9CHLO